MIVLIKDSYHLGSFKEGDFELKYYKESCENIFMNIRTLAIRYYNLRFKITRTDMAIFGTRYRIIVEKLGFFSNVVSQEEYYTDDTSCVEESKRRILEEGYSLFKDWQVGLIEGKTFWNLVEFDKLKK